MFQRPHERLAQGLPCSNFLGQKVRYDLRVRLGANLTTAPLELFFKLSLVLDDAVVDHCDLRSRLPAAGVWMGICLTRSSVRRPSSVAHTASHPQEVSISLLDGTLQVGQGPPFIAVSILSPGKSRASPAES